MYHAIVRAKVRSVFTSINDGDYQPMLDGLAPRFEYVFHGDHALGGRRTSLAAMRRWWQRIGRLLPGARFELHEVVVNGWPWHTVVAVRSTVSGALPGGEPYSNTVFQFMRLCWGRVTAVETMEDLQVLERALAAVAVHDPEAAAPPIEG